MNICNTCLRKYFKNRRIDMQDYAVCEMCETETSCNVIQSDELIDREDALADLTE